MGSKAQVIAKKVHKLLAELSRECTWDVEDSKGHRTLNPQRAEALDELVCIESTLLYMIKCFDIDEYLNARIRMSQPAKYVEE